MPRLPDRFDLWVRQARRSTEPARQLDLILGGLMSVPEVHFLNIGSAKQPVIAQTRIDDEACAPIVTNPERFLEAMPDSLESSRPPSTLAVATEKALAWAVENKVALLINPGVDEAALIPVPQVAAFHAEWKLRPVSTGFWIPGLTTEEEDFWQQHGL